ncbi:hypothetical protein MMPV_009870 [Pyropia vietnamensis]
MAPASTQAVIAATSAPIPASNDTSPVAVTTTAAATAMPPAATTAAPAAAASKDDSAGAPSPPLPKRPPHRPKKRPPPPPPPPGAASSPPAPRPEILYLRAWAAAHPPADAAGGKASAASAVAAEGARGDASRPWKFSKMLQIRLLRRALSPEAVGKADFALLLRYVGTMRGASRGKTLSQALAAREALALGEGVTRVAGVHLADGADAEKLRRRVRKRARKLVRVLNVDAE